MAYQQIFAALADPTRRQVFGSLRDGSKTVGDLSRTQPVSRPAVSQHLKVLQQAGLVNVRPHGTRRYYSVRQEGLADLRTRVELTHARWQAIGDNAAQMRDGYEKGGVGVFEQAYLRACSA